MLVLTTDIDKFKSEFPNIYALNIPIKSSNIQHEMMLNNRFKDNLCVALIRRYGIFACSDRWLLTDEMLKSHLSCIVDYGNPEEYNIQGYKDYFSRVPVLRDRVFSTYKEFCDYIQNNQVGVKFSHTVNDFGVVNILKILRDTGGFTMPNIEESIRIAMKELGIDTDDIETEVDETEVEDNSDITEELVEDVKDTVELDDDDNTTIDEDGAEESESNPAVYVKIKDGVAALIFSSDIKFQHKELGGRVMNVLSFKVPDVNSEKLQELELILEDETKTKKPEDVKKVVDRTPIVKADDTADSDDVLTELKNQKQAIDLQIKEARSDGDTELVNSLRKQRRALRNKINSMGG